MTSRMKPKKVSNIRDIRILALHGEILETLTIGVAKGQTPFVTPMRDLIRARP